MKCLQHYILSVVHVLVLQRDSVQFIIVLSHYCGGDNTVQLAVPETAEYETNNENIKELIIKIANYLV